ncbi:MAG: hypothetical protein ACXVY6_15775 [Gaiellaceae bacterium]
MARRSPPLWAWLAIGLLVAAITEAIVHESCRRPAPLPLKPISAVGSVAPAPPAGRVGPEGVPVPDAKPLAPAGWLNPGQRRDEVGCQPIEQLAYHIHAHLTVFVNGVARLIPYGIGIAPPWIVDETPDGPFVTGGRCFAWLHTHASDGIVHIESPTAKTYTLGDFFDIWGEPLGPNRLGPGHGRVTAFFDDHYYAGNPRQIPLLEHAQIQLELGRRLVAPESITFPDGL